MDVARQWLSLHLTCRDWAAALDEVPVAVAACVPIPAALPWLHRHATTLRLRQVSIIRGGPSDVADAAEEEEEAQLLCGPVKSTGRFGGLEESARLEFEDYIRRLSMQDPFLAYTRTDERRDLFHYKYLHFPVLGISPVACTVQPWKGDPLLPMLNLPAMSRLEVGECTSGWVGGRLGGRVSVH